MQFPCLKQLTHEINGVVIGTRKGNHTIVGALNSFFFVLNGGKINRCRQNNERARKHPYLCLLHFAAQTFKNADDIDRIEFFGTRRAGKIFFFDIVGQNQHTQIVTHCLIFMICNGANAFELSNRRNERAAQLFGKHQRNATLIVNRVVLENADKFLFLYLFQKVCITKKLQCDLGIFHRKIR